MARMSGKVQRSTKAERIAAEGVLKELWVKAYTDGEVRLDYRSADADEVALSDLKNEATVIHTALADYRKKIRSKQTENFDLFVMISAVSLRRESEYVVVLERKKNSYSERTTAILNVIERFPELSELNTTGNNAAPDIEEILKNFRKQEI